MFAQRQTGRRQATLGRDLASRAQHKVAPNGSRVRNNQRRRRQNQVAVKNYVEIKRSRPPKDSANAPRLALDFLQRFKKLERPERRFERRDGVRKKRLLARPADRKRLPNRANRLNRRRFRRRLGKKLDGAANRFVGSAPFGAQVRAERNQRRRRRRVVRFAANARTHRTRRTAVAAPTV